MRQRIALFAPAVAVLVTTIAVAFIIDLVLFDDLTKNAQSDSFHNANSVALNIAKLPANFADPIEQGDVVNPTLAPLQHEVRLLSKAFEDRVTIITEDGIVLADSDLTSAEIRQAKNHSDRPEILGARLIGHGSDQRRSKTLGIDFIYSAVTLEVGNTEVFIRIAKPMEVLYAQRDFIRGLLSLGAAITVAIVSLMSIVFGRQLSGLVNQTQLEKIEFSVNERTAILGALQQLGSMLAICNNLEEAGDVVEAQIPILMPGSSGALSLMNNSRNLMVVEHEWGDIWRKGEYMTSDSCWSLRKNEVHFSNNGELKCKHLEPDDNVRTMCIPLTTQGETLGIIHLRENAETPFSEDSIGIAKSLGREIATAISNLNLRRVLQQQALHDPLTGLHNRRHLEDQFDVLTTQASYENKRCCLLIIDVDHFKSYNDQYGHDAGDFVLLQLAKQFRKSMKPSDLVCRLGGEEFGILMFDADTDEALEFANGLRVDIENMDLVFNDRPLGEITISVGISSFPDAGITLSSLLKAADEFLYEAKNSGRNRVCYKSAA